MSSAQMAVLDTNIVLDLFLFQDPQSAALREQVQSGLLRWIATQHMRNELERVLTYEHITTKLAFYQKSAQDILADFDRHAQLTAAPPSKAPYTCKDADDQPFIDLACHLALATPVGTVSLFSKDKAVLSLRKRLEKLSILVRKASFDRRHLTNLSGANFCD
ncbi:MAG: putative toxin-antitoxin system toxin component, PIN family [Brachymonas sp.]